MFMVTDVSAYATEIRHVQGAGRQGRNREFTMIYYKADGVSRKRAQDIQVCAPATG